MFKSLRYILSLEKYSSFPVFDASHCVTCRENIAGRTAPGHTHKG